MDKRQDRLARLDKLLTRAQAPLYPLPGENRRRHIRERASVTVHLGDLEASLVNLSVGGLLAIATGEYVLQRGDEVVASLPLEPDAPDFHVVLHVTRVAPTEAGTAVAGRFVELPSRTYEVIQIFTRARAREALVKNRRTRNRAFTARSKTEDANPEGE